MLKGRAFKFDDNISTDYITLGQLAQTQSTEVMLGDPSLDVAKMLPNLSKKIDIIREFESEPHRNRTCNLLIKSLVASFTFPPQPVAG